MLYTNSTREWTDVVRETALETANKNAITAQNQVTTLSDSVDAVSGTANSAYNLASQADANADGVRTDMETNYATNTSVSTVRTELASQIKQTNTDVTANFSKTTAMITETNGRVDQVKTDVSTMIRMNANGVEVGKTDSDYKTLASNDGFYIQYKGSNAQWLAADSTHMANAVVEGTLQLQSGDSVGFTFGRRSNGNLYIN